MTIQEKAQEFAAMFEQKNRDNGRKYYVHNGPNELNQLCMKAHNGMMPDDWKYDFIVEALEAIAEGDTPDTWTIEADIYNSDRLDWLASSAYRLDYCDEAAENFGKADTIIETIGWGQYFEKEEVYNSVYSFLEELVNQ